MADIQAEPIATAENRWQYRGWKIELTPAGIFQCVRIRPTKWFVATSLSAAKKAINRREGLADVQLRLLPNAE